MKKRLVLALGLLVLAGETSASRAEWGWPPPGYSVSTFQAPDGRIYHGLCAKCKRRRQARLGTPCDPPASNGVVPVDPGPQSAANTAATSTVKPASRTDAAVSPRR
jgi:hypothetical protein